MALKSTNSMTARVEGSFKQLSSAAQTLHSATDDLSKVIRQLDVSLKKLGLGFPAWVQVSGEADEVQYLSHDLGYAKVDGKWGLALREVTGNHLDTDDDAEEIWGFNDAPRALRVDAVGKIPDLLEKLLAQTEETTKKLQAKIAQAAELASVFSDLTGGVPALPQWNRHGIASESAREIEGNGGEKPAAASFREGVSFPGERALPVEKPLPAERS
ncbi:hypothetical protein [Granulicella tundricola]|uniref:Uncharacterized protein n=1 Tax=Granulicella tundricola (strain ATCC BAA-1859 / DSM 23138 / MP5ACTX9) TaxID=1198114 RepID=E8X659_GRATM|nr:hypothetical protein [Granulicella tundricola]ADW70943.1 hypothetical protein AciX9_4163 [Granulicella tundricola MP5ACTX9]